MSDAVRRLKEELALLETRAEGIRYALSILGDSAEANAPKQIEGPDRPGPVAAQPKHKTGRPPKPEAKKSGKGAGKALVPVAPVDSDNDGDTELETTKQFTIGGKLVILTVPQNAMMELMVGAGDGQFVTSDTLKGECHDDAYTFQREMRELRTKLEAIGYTVEGVRGSGYRVQKASK